MTDWHFIHTSPQQVIECNQLSHDYTHSYTTTWTTWVFLTPPEALGCRNHTQPENQPFFPPSVSVWMDHIWNRSKIKDHTLMSLHAGVSCKSRPYNSLQQECNPYYLLSSPGNIHQECHIVFGLALRHLVDNVHCPAPPPPPPVKALQEINTLQEKALLEIAVPHGILLGLYSGQCYRVLGLI